MPDRTDSGQGRDALVQVNVASPKRHVQPIGYVVRDDGCWEWTGVRTKDGHARMRVNGRMVYVHRHLWEQKNGPIPAGMEMDHFACDNSWCVNPDHVRPTTHRENVLRGASFAGELAGRTHCANGHELTGDNLDQYGLKRGRRNCLKCTRARNRRNYHKRKAAQ